MGMGAGNPAARSLAGLAWLMWTVCQAEPSSYITWYGLGTLFHHEWALPSWSQLVGTLRRSGQYKDETSLAVWIGSGRSWGWGHLLVGH